VRQFILGFFLMLTVVGGITVGSLPKQKRLFRITFTSDQSTVLYEATSVENSGMCSVFRQQETSFSKGYVSAVLCAGHVVVEVAPPSVPAVQSPSSVS
jgi:hypothetical protein